METAQQQSGFEAEDIVEAIHAVMHSYRACLFRAMRDNPHGITPMDAKVLNHVARHPGSTQRDLVMHSGKDKGQLARLITGLRKRNLIKVEVDDQDRRSLKLYLTAAGENIQADILEQRQEINGEIRHKLNTTERQTLMDLVEKLRLGIDSVNHKISD